MFISGGSGSELEVELEQCEVALVALLVMDNEVAMVALPLVVVVCKHDCIGWQQLVDGRSFFGCRRYFNTYGFWE